MDNFQFNKHFENKTIMKKVVNDFVLKLMFNVILHNLHNGLPFLPERMKIEKIEQLVANLHDKTQYVLHIEEALNRHKRGIKSWISF